jgi:uncharacterized membrane protein YvbJ
MKRTTKKYQGGGEKMGNLEQKARRAAGYSVRTGSNGPVTSTIADKTKRNGVSKSIWVQNSPMGSVRYSSKTNPNKGTKKTKLIERDSTGKIIDESKYKGPSFKTGGIVNPNASVQASKVSKGRPAKSAEPKSAAKKATGKVGGISKAPKTATPKSK